MDSKDFLALEDAYKVMYAEAKDESPEKEEEDRKKDDDLFGSPNKKKNGKKADKDYDGDGKVESSKDEYFGSKDKAIKKAMGKDVKEARWWDVDMNEAMVVTNADKKANTPAYQNYKKGDKRYVAADHMKEEEGIAKVVGYLDELKKSTLGSYIAKGSKDLADRRFDQGDSEKRKYEPDEEDDKEDKKLDKREQGIARAAKKLAKEEVISEKQKDTPDQVKAVIAYDKARKGTEDAVYDTEHGKKKQAKKERDYAKWQRDKGAEDAQKSGHPWEHAKGSTREKEGKKSEKHAHIKDSFNPSEFIQKLVESGKFSEEEIGRMIEVDRLSESGWHRRNPEKVGTPEDPDYRVLKGSGKVRDIKDSKPATTGPASKKPPGIYKPDKDGKMVRQPD